MSEKYDPKLEGPRSQCHPYDANLISSKTLDGKHKILLDLDIEHYYVQSTTGGHAHLFLNVPLEFDEMVEVLTVLQKYNIIQKGFLDATKDRKWAALRMPGMHKSDPENNRWFYEDKQSYEKWSSDDTYTPYKSVKHEMYETIEEPLPPLSDMFK